MKFGVDEVEPAREPLATRPFGTLYPGALAVAGDLDAPVIDHGAAHPLLAAVGLAFAQHRPLVLTPDAVWLTIAQGVAQHVRLHAEQLRGRLVRHAGRKELTLKTGAVPQTPAGWAASVAGFRGLLAEEIGDGRARLFTCDFSTSSEVDRVASEIVLLDAYSPYFTFVMVAICGIPTITLTGTVEDWTEIRERIDVIAELDLDPWCRSLRPIADQFVRAAYGDVDVEFWRRIYNPIDAYGGEQITGWITRLYPYVEADGTLDRPNPMLALPIDEPKLRTRSNKDRYNGPGLHAESIPATVSRVSVLVIDERESTRKRIDLVAGVVAVTQDSDGALRSIAGWRVENGATRIEDVVERIKREHVSEPACPDERRFLEGPGDVLAFYAELERATLFAGDRAWRIRAPKERRHVNVERAGGFSIGTVVDLPDGKVLCVATRYRSTAEYWLVCRVEESSDGYVMMAARALDLPADIPVFEGSFAQLLEEALDNGGDVSRLFTRRFHGVLHQKR